MLTELARSRDQRVGKTIQSLTLYQRVDSSNKLPIIRSQRRGVQKRFLRNRPSLERPRILRARLRSREVRLLLDESRRGPAIQHGVDIVQSQHSHYRAGFDRGAADMRQ